MTKVEGSTATGRYLDADDDANADDNAQEEGDDADDNAQGDDLGSDRPLVGGGILGEGEGDDYYFYTTTSYYYYSDEDGVAVTAADGADVVNGIELEMGMVLEPTNNAQVDGLEDVTATDYSDEDGVAVTAADGADVVNEVGMESEPAKDALDAGLIETRHSKDGVNAADMGPDVLPEPRLP